MNKNKQKLDHKKWLIAQLKAIEDQTLSNDKAEKIFELLEKNNNTQFIIETFNEFQSLYHK